MKFDFIKGIVPPIIIPIDKNEQIDEKKLRKHVDFIIDNGVDGILAFGSNGEFYSFDEAEMFDGLSIILDQTAKRIPVYMGIGAINTNKCIRIAKRAVGMGCDGISILQPMFLKPTEDELFLHFKSIADSVPETPVLLYNNPGRTGYPISQDVVEKLAHTVSNIVGMKDSSGDLTQTSEFIRRNKDVGFKVFCGKDTLIYAGLCIGAVGAVCCTANFIPKLVCEIYKAFNAGDMNRSLDLQFKLNPIRLQMDKSSFPVATKDYCNIVGLDIGNPLLPNLCSPDKQISELRDRLKEANLLK